MHTFLDEDMVTMDTHLLSNLCSTLSGFFLLMLVATILFDILATVFLVYEPPRKCYQRGSNQADLEGSSQGSSQRSNQGSNQSSVDKLHLGSNQGLKNGKGLSSVFF